MSMLSGYPSISDAGSMPATSPTTNGVRVFIPQTNYGYGDFQFLTVQLEENSHQLQENSKWLKKFCKKKKASKNKKSFLQKVGDAFCKALPAILTTVTTAVVSLLFKTPSSKKALQTA